jgi:iron complex transport system ATP-binding protein
MVIAMVNPPVLDIRGLDFSYGAQRVFSDVSLPVSAGDVVCLMGPNGCGKTTLLDAIMGLKKPQAGEILLNGRQVGDYKRHEIARNIAYVPQLHDVTFPYTVREMVLMGRTAYTSAFGKPTREDEAICADALRRIGIAHFSEKLYSRLSGGEIKLVLLARALGQSAPVMLLDEPTAHLDYKNELLFLETVVGQCRAGGLTVILATHAPDHAFYLASKGLAVRAVMMAQGRLECCGEPDDVITSENIRAVYGVRAKIMTDTDLTGRPVKRVMLLETA